MKILTFSKILFFVTTLIFTAAKAMLAPNYHEYSYNGYLYKENKKYIETIAPNLLKQTPNAKEILYINEKTFAEIINEDNRRYKEKIDRNKKLETWQKVSMKLENEAIKTIIKNEDIVGITINKNDLVFYEKLWEFIQPKIKKMPSSKVYLETVNAIQKNLIQIMNVMFFLKINNIKTMNGFDVHTWYTQCQNLVEKISKTIYFLQKKPLMP